ncbi:hypothetical protein BDZ85DRAFT_263412 [Elsinoe ampelina]|uniref:Uncharacterized protein n=1 Tax=Elsinoe ampelina TaxID=302913 RepID=A0A6A6G999_9PEZI|nr:hypothetical protein BDZ85DRAFT_263412 [Elsinoe ampelina]
MIKTMHSMCSLTLVSPISFMNLVKCIISLIVSHHKRYFVCSLARVSRLLGT